jgi:AMMECR1 domain-containing protein
MIKIAKQTLDFYLKNFKTPTIDDLEIENKTLLDKKGSLFITLYKK